MRACPKCKTPYLTAIEFCGIDGTRLVESASDPLIGSTLDRYRVVDRIGGGGMAAVYRAVHTVIDRQCALKVLFGELASDKAFTERFKREAQTASRIKHPNVVEVLDFGTTSDGASFLLMELLEGRPLNTLIQAEGPLTPSRTAWLARDVAAGLAAAHALGFVHRDLKPANVMVVIDQETGYERAKILDFGLVLSHGPEDAGLTKSGQTLGTPYYMAPEQIEGATVTGRTDLYALGVMMHEMLTASRPFVGTLSDVLRKHAIEPPPPLKASGGLEVLVKQCLEKAPTDRPASANDVVRTIESMKILPTYASPLSLSAMPAMPAISGGAGPSGPASGGAGPSGPANRAASGDQSLASLVGDHETRSERAPVSESVRESASAPTETAMQARPPPVPSTTSGALSISANQIVSAHTPTSPTRAMPGPRAPAGARPGVPLAATITIVGGLALFAFVGGVDGVKAIVRPLQAQAVEAGDKAVRSTLDDPGPTNPVAPKEDVAAIGAKLDADITDALDRRGLVRADVNNMPEVLPFLQKFDAARASSDASALHAAGATLVKEIARARLSSRVVDGCLNRAARALRDRADTLGPKTRASFERRLRDLERRAREQRSEAERGQIVLDVASLERDIRK